MKAVCEALGVARSHVHAKARRDWSWQDRRRQPRPSEDAQLVEQLRSEIQDLPSYGYRRAGALVNRRREAHGQPRVNAKRVYRVMRDNDLLLTRHSGRPPDTRSHEGKIAVDKSNARWCSDGFEIACESREKVRIAFALDCCDREAMGWVATTGGIDGSLIRDLMTEAVEYRFGAHGPPKKVEWLTDNGSNYIAKGTRKFARDIGLIPLTTAICSPQSNGMAESFVKTFKRDYVTRMDRSNALAVIEQLPAAFEHYNEVHPHSALKMLSPRMFRRKCDQLSAPVCPEV